MTGDKPLAAAIAGVLSMLKKKRPSEEAVGEAWVAAVGERAASHTRPVTLKKSVLTVMVDQSGWLYELATRKKEIVAALKKTLGAKRIKDVRLRIGDIGASAPKQEKG